MCEVRKRKYVGEVKILKYWNDWANSDNALTNTKCWVCGELSDLQKCHIVPFSLGGECSPENMILMCPQCHYESPDCLFPTVFWHWAFLKKNKKITEISAEGIMKACIGVTEIIHEWEINKKADFLEGIVVFKKELYQENDGYVFTNHFGKIDKNALEFELFLLTMTVANVQFSKYKSCGDYKLSMKEFMNPKFKGCMFKEMFFQIK